MSGCETLQSVQFVTVNAKRFAVIDADDWESFVYWLEELEDRQIVGKYLDELKGAGDRPRASWPKWEAVSGELE
jgi:hypothetical protein